MTVLTLPGIAEDDALERAVGVKRSLASMEADQYLYLLEYLDECAADPDVLRLCGAQRVHPYGGDGTPDIPEFAVCEIAAALGLTTRGASSLVADILDTRHRFPLLFACLRDGDVEAYRVRLVAGASRDLSLEQAAQLDERLARRNADEQPLLARLPRSKVFDVVEQFRCADESETVEDEVVKNLAERHLVIRGGQNRGVEDVSGSLSTADARRLDGRVDQIAGWLAELGSTDCKDVRRSIALGMLADPGSVADLWDRVHAHRTGTAADVHDDPDPHDDDPSAADPTAEQPTTSEGGCVSGSGSTSASDRREAGADAFRRSLPPTVTLYIHFDRESATWSLDGAGPITRSEAIDILGHARVTIKPVIDLEQNLTYTGYVAPPKLKEQLALMNGGRCSFPHCTRSAWRGEYDHRLDYRARGPTDSRNGHRLCKHHHRCKTFTEWIVSSPAPGIWVWRSPRGRFFLVTAGTTTPLDLDVFRYAA